jgi:hypothetical protein
LWTLGREGVLALVSRPSGTPAEIGDIPQVVSSGPVGHLAAALGMRPINRRIASQLATEALGKLSADDFHADMAPFLKGDCWTGQAIISLAEALRQLDSAEIDALTALIPATCKPQEIADSLRLLSSKRDRDVRTVLPEVFERLWNRSVKASVENALRDIAAGDLPALFGFLDRR